MIFIVTCSDDYYPAYGIDDWAGVRFIKTDADMLAEHVADREKKRGMGGIVCVIRVQTKRPIGGVEAEFEVVREIEYDGHGNITKDTNGLVTD